MVYFAEYASATVSIYLRGLTDEISLPIYYIWRKIVEVSIKFLMNTRTSRPQNRN